jgi:hypothetical protein
MGRVGATCSQQGSVASMGFPKAVRVAIFNIEHPTSNAEHRSFQPSAIRRSMFDVQRLMFPF